MEDLIKREDAIKGKQAQTLNANAEFMMGRFCNEDENRIYNIGFAEGWNAHIERCKDIPSAEPTIEIDADQLAKLLREGWTIHSEPKQGEGIPIKWHEITEEEREEEGYPEEWSVFIDSVMPNDGERILVTTKHGEVEIDTCYEDVGFYLDSGWDWVDDIIAWRPLPKPWEGADNE